MAETDPYVSSGGGIAGNVLHARNTIIAGNTGGGYVGAQDIYGGLGSLGHNLIGNTQGGSGFDPTDLLNVDPLLGPLQDNGGPTKTMALLPGSPAIDAGDNTGAPDWDQRGPGFPRIVNGIIDVGAFEVQGGGSGPGRSGSLHAKAVHLDVAALLPLAISPSPASFSGPGSLNAQPQDTVAGQHATIVDRLFASLDKDSAFAWAQRKLVAPSEVSSNQALGGLGDGAGEEKEDAASFLI